MTEHRDPYDSGAAPAPAATCPTLDECESLRAALEKLTTENNALRVTLGRKAKANKWRTDSDKWDPFAFTIHPLDNQGQSYCRWPDGSWLTAGFTLTKVMTEFQRLRAIPTPADPLTALEREALEAMVAWRKLDRHAMPFLMDADRPNDVFYAASRELRAAADRLINAARAAVGRESIKPGEATPQPPGEG